MTSLPSYTRAERPASRREFSRHTATYARRRLPVSIQASKTLMTSGRSIPAAVSYDGVYHCTWQPLLKGGHMFLRNPNNWDPAEAMAAMEEHEITSFNGVTAMYVDMVNHESFGEYDLSSLESVGEGGAKMSVTVQEEFESVAGVNMYEGYGLTETSGATHAGHESTFGPRLGSIGQPFRMTDCKIVDDEGNEVKTGEEGELLIRGPHVMKAYHNLPEKDRAGLRRTGIFPDRRSGSTGRG